MIKSRYDCIFRGWIKHFSDKAGRLAVDWFDDVCNLHFLSHAHSDHFSFKHEDEIIGLLEPDFIQKLKSRPHSKIFCTGITRSIIRRLPRAKDDVLDELNKHFVILKLNETREIQLMDSKGNLSQEKINVTTIPANHIPGAVMFLFEDDEKRALYTGDFRYDVREEKKEMEALKKFVKDYKKVIDYLYVDITCLDIGKLYHPDQNKLPTRKESKDMVCELIEEIKPTSFHIDADMLGAEDMVKAVARFSNNTADEILSRLEVDCPKSQLYEYTLKGLGQPTTKRALWKTDVHIFHKAIFDEYEKCGNCDNETMRIRASLKWIFKKPSSGYSYGNRETWNKDGAYWQILYSHHSSDAELRDFLSRLQYREVIPISKPILRYLEKSSNSEEEHQSIRQSLYLTLDKSNSKPKKVLWFMDNNRDLRVGGKFRVTVKDFNNYYDVLGNVHPNKYLYINYHYIVIPCPKEQRTDINRLINDIIGRLRYRGTYVLFYSITDDFSDIWRQEAKLFNDQDVLYIDLSKVQAYIESDNPLEVETQIVIETLMNLNRNRNKVVSASDWPMPYEFSERKRKYEIEKERQMEPESQEVEMHDGENEDESGQDNEPQSQEIQMAEPQT